MKKKTTKMKTINHKKIKRDLLIRDTGLDSRFTTKVGADKKKYSRKEKHKNK